MRVVDNRGRDIDHVAAVAFQHLGYGPLGETEEAGHVYAEHQRVILGGVVGERLGHKDAGIIDQRVDPPETAQCGVDDLTGGGGVAEVTRDGEHLRVRRRVHRLGIGHHRPALAPVSGDDPGADALRSAGDDGNAALRLAHAGLARDPAGPAAAGRAAMTLLCSALRVAT
jgi:hypothetical protein